MAYLKKGKTSRSGRPDTSGKERRGRSSRPESAKHLGLTRVRTWLIESSLMPSEILFKYVQLCAFTMNSHGGPVRGSVTRPPF
jgi:hypothetical protein